MNRMIRSLALTAALSAGVAAMAQFPYEVTVYGTVADCTPNSFVNIATLPGTEPAQDIDVPVLPPTCSFSVTLNMNTATGGFIISTPCQGAIQTDTVLYETDPVLDSAMVYVVFNCGGTAPDCLGVPGGPAVQGTPCITPGGETGVFDADCSCVPLAVTCIACFTVVQDSTGNSPTPFVANFLNCSTSSGGDYTLNWDAYNVGNTTGESAQFTFPGPGVYPVCLWMVGNTNNCTSTFCDSVFVDADGNITLDGNPSVDCLGIANGPNMPGTACITFANEPGTWNTNCVCIPNTPAPCSANFTATQGFANGSTVPFGVEVISIEASNIGGPTPTVDWGDGNTTLIGSHIYAAAGTYTVCVNATNPQGVTCSSCRPITIDANGTLSTSTQTPPFQLQVQVGMTGGCIPGTVVRLQSIQGTLPVFEVDYVLDSTCSFIDLLDMTSSSGWIQATYFCDTETTTSALAYDFGGGSSGIGFFFSNCPGLVDCLGVLGGTATPGTPCSTPGNGEGTWSANCECVPNTNLPCEAAFWVMQAYEIVPVGNDTTEVQPIPFELWIWNQSSGGTGNYQFSWDFGDGTVSSDAFPTHVYGASGPYEICLTMTDDAGCTDTFCDEVSVDQDGILGMITGGEVRSALTVKVIDSLPTSVSEQAGLEATNLWPNPVNEGFTLALNSSRSGTLTFDVVDLQGKVVRSHQFGVSTGSNRLTMDTHGIDAGLYMLRVSNGQHSTSLRFVKQ